MTDALKMVAEQAEDEGLWCKAATATEAHLQQALRWLHYAVEQSQADRAELLEATQTDWRTAYCEAVERHNKTLDELREAQAAQPQAEPVAWLEEAAWGRSLHLTKPDYGKAKWRAPEPKLTPLYTHPTGRRPMTYEELRNALRDCPYDTAEVLRVPRRYAKDFARAIEKFHGITGEPTP